MPCSGPCCLRGSGACSSRKLAVLRMDPDSFYTVLRGVVVRLMLATSELGNAAALLVNNGIGAGVAMNGGVSLQSGKASLRKWRTRLVLAHHLRKST